MPDWNTRLEVRLGDQVISPITSLQTTITAPHTAIHSLEADNVGVSAGPTTISLVAQIPANATAVADLTELALTGGEFQIAVAENTGTDWAFKAMKFQRCMVTSAAPSNIAVDGVPQASFTCIVLSMSLED